MTIPFQILIFWFLCLAIHIFINGKKSIFIIFLLSWWFFWNFINSLGITGLFTLSQNTQNLYFLFFGSSVMGAFLFSLLPRNKMIPKAFQEYSIAINRHRRLIFIFLGCFVFPIVFFFFLRALYLIHTRFSLVEYRSEVFGLNTGTSLLFFNSKLISLFYFWVINPLQYMMIFFGVVRRVLFKENSLVVLTFITLVMDAVVMAGRFSFHFLLFLAILIYSFEFIQSKNTKTLLNNTIYLATIFILLITGALIVTLIRDSSNLTALSKIFNLYVLTYHTESFTILSQELNNPKSIVHDFTIWKSFWGGLLKYPIFILNYFGMNFVSEESIIGGYLHQNIVVGYTDGNKPIELNAFGSIFFNIYRDGKQYAIVVYGLFFGFFSILLTEGFFRKNSVYIVLLTAWCYIWVYGIFQPYIDGAILPAILGSFLIAIVLNFYRGSYRQYL